MSTFSTKRTLNFDESKILIRVTFYLSCDCKIYTLVFFYDPIRFYDPFRFSVEGSAEYKKNFYDSPENADHHCLLLY